MRALLQRVTRASVTVDGELISEIGTGFLILLGVTQEDTAEEGTFLAGKVANLRVFEDDAGAMNRSALDLLGDEPADVAMLVVSQFTLYADARKGRRPSFVKAARPEQASPLVDAFADELRALGLPVKQGVFGAEMKVELLNDGPVTIWLDTAELRG
ncbi:MAG: D-tyrosyl-tRNA(Tyr) deacylase [Planctomycetales bacterium]|nr:D-tyrosyl-tRNA(Tyr) deacylase [Planctomycetales bacterium]